MRPDDFKLERFFARCEFKAPLSAVLFRLRIHVGSRSAQTATRQCGGISQPLAGLYRVSGQSGPARGDCQPL